MTVQLWCDGLCDPNPGGWLCWAFVAQTPDGQVLHTAAGSHRPAPGNTNNVAELGAALRALQWAAAAGHADVALHSDSQIAVRYLTEGGHHAALEPLAAKARALLPPGTPVRWVPGSVNTAADALTRQEFTRRTGRAATDWSAIRPKRHSPGSDAA